VSVYVSDGRFSAVNQINSVPELFTDVIGVKLEFSMHMLHVTPLNAAVLTPKVWIACLRLLCDAEANAAPAAVAAAVVAVAMAAPCRNLRRDAFDGALEDCGVVVSSGCCMIFMPSTF